MNRTEKEQFVEELRADLATAKSVVLACHQGIEVNKVNELRSMFRKQGVEYRVIKNTLAHIAFQGTDMAGLSDFLVGPIAIAYSTEDAIAPAKVAKEFSKKTEKFEIRGGYMDGDVFDAKGVERLADLPSKEELRSKLLGLFQAVPSQFLRTLNAAPQQFLMVLKAREEQLGA